MLWLILLALAFPGHAALCLFVSNNLNAVVVNRTLKHLLSVPVEALLVLAPFGMALAVGTGHWPPGAWPNWSLWQTAVACYLALANFVAIVFVPRWLHRQLRTRPTELLLSNHTTTIDLAPQLQNAVVASGLGRVFLSVPGNESLHLAVHHKSLRIPRLPPALDGLTITHLSDLHFTGRVGRSYFEEVVRRANELQSDLVAITGDLVDSPRCLEWLPETLGRLRAVHGVYFVLGNHDLRAGPQQVRRLLTECGLIDLSGRWLAQTLRGQRALLAGNERPWFKPAADMSSCPASREEEREFRILLSHSPDQYPWAQQHDFDLMLAGHTHGGQIRLPGIGPLLAPSRYGVRYAAGTFYLPPVVMHVSRGISGLQPLRFNCPPELTQLILRS